MFLHGCTQLANVDGLWGFAGLLALQTLTLDLRGSIFFLTPS